MIYKSAPAWTMHSKTSEHKQPPTPSPVTYQPANSTLVKSPSWKIGKEMRSKEEKQKSPSPSTYHPRQPQKHNKMGVIGRAARSKQNAKPGPVSYHTSPKQQSQHIPSSKKNELNDQKISFPGSVTYEVRSKKQKKGVAIGKQARFTTQTTTNPGPTNYEVLLSRPNSATKFTKAPRMSHQAAREALGPGQYTIKREFEDNQQKGYTLGQKLYYSTAVQSPGPADYSPSHQNLQTSPSISFSKKYKPKDPDRSPSPNQYNPQYKIVAMKTESYSIGKAERLPLHAENSIPGPGAYLKTEYANSGVEVSLGVSRKRQEREDFPGPGAYNPNKAVILKRPSTAKLGKSPRFYKMNTQTSNASYYDSKVEICSPKYSFSRQKRMEEKCREGPGPGSYATPSALCNLSPYASRI